MIAGCRTVVGQAAVVVVEVGAGRVVVAVVVAMRARSKVDGRVDMDQVSSGAAVKLDTEVEPLEDGDHMAAGHSTATSSRSRPAGDRFDDVTYLVIVPLSLHGSSVSLKVLEFFSPDFQGLESP